MKVLRGLLVFILSFVLTTLIIGLTVTASVKDVIQNQLMGEMVKQLIIRETDDDDDNNVQLDAVDKIFSYKETNDIINSAISDYVNYVEGNTNGISKETVDMIINFCIEHKSDLEEISGEELNIDEINSPEVRDRLIDSVNESINEVKIDKSSPVIKVVSAYGEITSNDFKIKVLALIGILVLLIGTISWSLYKWMKPVGSALITSGVVVSLLYVLIEVATNFANQSIGISISIDGKLILIAGIVELVSGIVILIIYAIINKIVSKKRLKKSNQMLVEDDEDEIEEKQELISNEVVEDSKEEVSNEVEEEQNEEVQNFSPSQEEIEQNSEDNQNDVEVL